MRFLILYLRWTIGRTKALPSWYANSKLLNELLLSARTIFAFVCTVSKMKTNAFKGHHFDLILVEWWVEIKYTTSTPPLVWSYITRTCGLHRWSFVTFTLVYIVVRTMILFLPDFFLSIYETSIISLSWRLTDNVDFSSLSIIAFNSLGYLFCHAAWYQQW